MAASMSWTTILELLAIIGGKKSEEYWGKSDEINLKPMFLMSEFAIPAMISSGDGGSIVNISSISATRPKG